MKTISENEYTKVVVQDEPSFGNACHDYDIFDNNNEQLTRIEFQKGPIGEYGANGCQIEDLLQICIHRLEGFQSGEFNCKENSYALDCINDALWGLNSRTEDRKKRSVEGLSKK